MLLPSCPGWWSSGRVHSRYDRRLADVAVANQPVVLRLRVRRFFCDENDCPDRTFAERVVNVTVKHARRTVLCRKVLTHIGLEMAGRAGSRLAAGLGLVACRSSLLRLLPALPEPPVEASGAGVSTTSRYVVATTTAWCIMMRPLIAGLTCCQTGSRPPSRRGCENIRCAGRSSGTARRPLPRPCAALYRTRSRYQIAGTSGTASPAPSRRP